MKQTIFKGNTDTALYSIEVKPKQKVIQINKLGSFIDLDANNKAQKELSITGYCLYMHLVKLADNAVWALSNVEVKKNTNLSIHQYTNAVEELIEKGYLVEEAIDLGDRLLVKNAYHFYEYPLN